MVASYDFTTTDLKQARLKLCDELVFSAQPACEGTFYHIEIPSKSQFFRVGYREYVFISQLDGKTSFAHALAVTAQQLGADAMTESDAAETVNWLLENGLANLVGMPAIDDAKQPPIKPATLFQKINPFWIKLPLLRPNELLNAISPYFSWLFNRSAIVLSGILFLVASCIVVTHHQAFVASAKQVFAPTNWFWILLTWVALKLVHELAHALVCYRLGGHVKETGVIFLLLAPMAYVDVTSAWRFSSRWHRMAVAVAGMYAELLIASICVIAWYWTTSQQVAYHLFNVISMASLSTILFNANPLMRFDGYFVLSDLMRIPNLYTQGNRALTSMLRWLFFGQRSKQDRNELNRQQWFISCYGMAAAVWKILICCGLLIAASVMFGGFGIFLVIIGVFSWLVTPGWKLFWELRRRRIATPHSLLRAVVVTGSIITLMIVSWFFIPNPLASRAPCLVDYREISKVRAPTDSFIEKVLVNDGDFVAAGTTLLVLENQRLTAEVAELTAKLNLQIVRERIALEQRKTAEAQIEQQNQAVTRKQLATKNQQLDRLRVKAPVDGRIVARNLQQKVGVFVSEGDVLLAVANESQKELVLSLSTDDISSASALVGEPIPVEIGSRRKIMARVSRVVPRASSRLTRPALAATNGGMLAVQERDNPSDAPGESNLELCKPRIEAIATIDPQTAQALFSGERGYALVQSRSGTLGQSIAKTVYDFFDRQLSQVQQLR